MSDERKRVAVMIDKDFWEGMARAWRTESRQIDDEKIKGIASQHAARDRRTRAGYHVNPLDDEGDDFDE